jgi:hypothetical protein
VRYDQVDWSSVPKEVWRQWVPIVLHDQGRTFIAFIPKVLMIFLPER